MNKEVVFNTLKALESSNNEVVVEQFNFWNSKENEFLIFFKPEIFINWNPEFIEKSINLVFQKLEENEIDVSWTILFKWDRLKELEIMDRHYGFINYISKNASKLPQEDLDKLFATLEISDRENYKVYGWHEFLQAHSGYTEETLDAFWLTKKSAKVRSWFYAQKYELNWEQIVLVNAFHPVQLKHYTDSTHKTLVVLCNSNKEWTYLKEQVAWDTFPEKAVRESIRWEFFANKEQYWLEDVSISFNCVHMSAGPFEALFEINNFLKQAKSANYDISKTNLYSRLSQAGISNDSIVNTLTNPKVEIDWKLTSLFDATENNWTESSVNIFKWKFL